MRETAARKRCACCQKDELASWFCHSRQDNETPCKSNRPVVNQANAFDSRLRGSRQPKHRVHSLNCEWALCRSLDPSSGLEAEDRQSRNLGYHPIARRASAVRAVKRTNWLRGFVTRDKTMKSNRPVVNQANAFDSRLRGSRQPEAPRPFPLLWMSSLSESRSLSGLVDRQSRKLPPASMPVGARPTILPCNLLVTN